MQLAGLAAEGLAFKSCNGQNFLSMLSPLGGGGGVKLTTYIQSVLRSRIYDSHSVVLN